VPRLAGVGRQAWGQRRRVKGALSSFQGLASLGLPAGTRRVGHVVRPIAPWEPGLCSPLLPSGGEGRVGSSAPDPGPPEVHDGRPGWQRRAPLGHGGVPDRPLLALGHRFDGRHCRLQGAGHLGGAPGGASGSTR
jgi:hypothetical protein